MLRVAINGFGRIGRMALRLLQDDKEVEVVAINNTTKDTQQHAYLYKYDSVHRKNNSKISFDEDELFVKNRKIKVFAEPDPSKLPWKELDIDIVLECTGVFTKKDLAEVITAPVAAAPAPAPEPAPEPMPAPEPEPEPAPAPEPEPEPVIIKEENVVVIDATPLPAPTPIAPIAPIEQDKQIVGISLYGTLISVPFPKECELKINKVSENDLASAWEYLTDSKFDMTIAACLRTKKDLALCDWAYMQMVRNISYRRFGNTNEAVVMTAFLMAQAGYKIRLAYAEERVYMLIASHQHLYNMTYYNIDNEKFFLVDKAHVKTMYICAAMYDNEQKMSLHIQQEQQFDFEPSEVRTLRSKKGIETNVQVNTNLVDFYGDYPSGYSDDNFVTRWANYANAKLDHNIRETLYPALKQAIDGKTQIQAVNLLLNWVQTAFEYGYDNEIWGQDRAFFAAETLFYPYSDCEDRSILFSQLVRDLLGLDVLLIYYPGHLATAVNVADDQVQGDYLVYHGKKFVVCDPTYINAPAGKTMPDMDNSTAKIALLSK